MGGWGLNAYDERAKARLNKRLQLEAVCAAILSDEPTMPPAGIHPSRFAAMVKSLKNAIEDGDENQVDDTL